MTDHRTYVQHNPDGFFAVCQVCGPDQFPDRVRLEDAERDAAEHGTLSHVYSRSELRRLEATR